MPATPSPLFVSRNASCTLSWTLTEPNGSPLDVSGSTVTFTVYRYTVPFITTLVTIEIGTGGIEISGSGSNVVVVSLSAPDTDFAEELRYDLSVNGSPVATGLYLCVNAAETINQSSSIVAIAPPSGGGGAFLPLAGGTLAGTLTMGSNPVSFSGATIQGEGGELVLTPGSGANVLIGSPAPIMLYEGSQIYEDTYSNLVLQPNNSGIFMMGAVTFAEGSTISENGGSVVIAPSDVTFIYSPLSTRNNTLDDGNGNVTIAGNTTVGGVLNANNEMIVEGDINAYSNLILQNGDVQIAYGRLYFNGYVTSILEDGSNNLNINAENNLVLNALAVELAPGTKLSIAAENAIQMGQGSTLSEDGSGNAVLYGFNNISLYPNGSLVAGETEAWVNITTAAGTVFQAGQFGGNQIGFFGTSPASQQWYTVTAFQALQAFGLIAPGGSDPCLTSSSSLNASNLVSGTVPAAQLGSGTASSSTFLRGDHAWSLVPQKQGSTITFTGQTAALSAQALLVSTTASGLYRISWTASVKTAATTSSALGGSTGFTVTFNDGHNNVAKTSTTGATSTANTVATTVSGSLVICFHTGVAATYSFGYTSSGATAMAFDLDIWVEVLS